MSDQQQPTPIDELVNRLASRIGALTAENEWLKVQLEQAQQDQPLPATNGQYFDDAMEGVGPV